jgi:hypothetical protein
MVHRSHERDLSVAAPGMGMGFDALHSALISRGSLRRAEHCTVGPLANLILYVVELVDAEVLGC